MTESTLRIDGMRCAACAGSIEKGVGKLDGVEDIAVNFATGMASVSYDPSAINMGEIQDKIIDIGFSSEEAVNPEQAFDLGDNERIRARKLFLQAFLFTVPVVVLSMMKMFQDESIFSAGFLGLLLWLLTTPVLFYAGREILLDAILQTKHFRANMSSLIALGSLSAYFYSVYVLFDVVWMHYLTRPHYYFETTAMIITLILLGRYLESRAKSRARHGIRALLELRPETATAIINNVEVQVEPAALKKDMIVFVKPGEKIAADGIIVEGAPSINESMLTGESVPVEKIENDAVIGGSVNGNKAFKFKVTGTGQETFLAGIIKLVTEAQNRKAPVQRLADRIAGVFVPIVLAIALFTLIIWFFADPSSPLLLTAPVAVLIVACPCALGLATPTAILAGTGRAARSGIFIRGGDILERLVKTQKIVFDKTGTLTEGRFEVISYQAVNNNEEELLRLAASVEKGSKHPLAEAIVAKAMEKKIELEAPKNISEYPGFGLKAEINGVSVAIGNSETMNNENIDISSLDDAAREEMSNGRTIVYASADDRLLGMFVLFDKLKDEAPKVIDELKNSGRDIVMLTGDNQRTAAGVATLLGISKFEAGIKPDQKSLIVKVFCQAGENVVMVGDGINDAPALAAADIGVALGSGTDAAIESADIILVNDNLESLTQAINISEMTYGTIKQNLFWAFFYNIISIPLAAGLFYPIFGWTLSPVVAAAAMSVSSLLVVSNSVRLLRSGKKSNE